MEELKRNSNISNSHHCRLMLFVKLKKKLCRDHFRTPLCATQIFILFNCNLILYITSIANKTIRIRKKIFRLSLMFFLKTNLYKLYYTLLIGRFLALIHSPHSHTQNDLIEFPCNLRAGFRSCAFSFTQRKLVSSSTTRDANKTHSSI